MSRWKHWVPGLQILTEYQAAWFGRDLMAGLVLTAMLVPVGIAYAVASGVPGINGLYALHVIRVYFSGPGTSRSWTVIPRCSNS